MRVGEWKFSAENKKQKKERVDESIDRLSGVESLTR